jgi:hypothetical protein
MVQNLGAQPQPSPLSIIVGWGKVPSLDRCPRLAGGPRWCRWNYGFNIWAIPKWPENRW